MGKISLVAEHQIATGDAPSVKHLVSDLAMPTGDVDQVLHVLVILGFISEKGSLVQHGLSRRCGLRRIFP